MQDGATEMSSKIISHPAPCSSHADNIVTVSSP